MTVAPGRSVSQASRIVSARPTTSKAWSTPPAVSLRTARAASGSDASTTCVAPRASARASFSLRGRRRRSGRPPRDAPRRPGARRPRSRRRRRSRPALPLRRCERRRTRDHRAADERRLPERQAVGNRHRRCGRDDAVLGEAGDSEEALEPDAVTSRYPEATVERSPRERCPRVGLAEVAAPLAAAAAGAARRQKAECDAGAGREAGDPAPTCSTTRHLVPEHRREAVSLKCPSAQWRSE